MSYDERSRGARSGDHRLGELRPHRPVLSNSDLEKLTDTSDEWIITRTGIKERRISHVEVSDLSTVAGLRALAAAGLDPQDIDLILLATCSPDRLVPSAATMVQHKMGATRAAAMDLNAACSGFVYSLATAHQMIATGAMDRVLIIGAEKLSYWLDFTDRSTSVLFGDGAGAVVLEPTDQDVGLRTFELGRTGRPEASSAFPIPVQRALPAAHRGRESRWRAPRCFGER